ncbi:MAG: ATP-binding protein, partial [Thermomicrobiales bacterium]
EYSGALPPIAGELNIADCNPEERRELGAGRTLVYDDTECTARSASKHEYHDAQFDVRALLTVPLRREGHLVASLAIAASAPRRWQQREISMAEAIAERTWLAVEKLRLDAELKAREERLRLGIEVAGFALLEVDYTTGLIHLSEEAARLYGLGNDAAVLPRERVHASFHPDDRQEMTRRIGIPPDPDAAESYTTEYRVLWPSGEVRWLSVRKRIVFDRSGPVPRPLRAMLAALDITERKRAEAERVAFVDAAAHDLRTPLTSLKAQAQLLMRRVQRGQWKDAAPLESGLATIDAAATRMVTLIDEMMDAAHLRAGRSLDLRLAPTNLVTLAEIAVEETRRSSNRHHVRIETAAPALVGEWDEVRLGRVLGNLLGNAVKYSPLGGDVVVRLSREDDAKGAWGILAVSDQGIGIPAADMPRLFSQFHRGANVASIGGSGIGLAGARQIVAQHGGTVAVESNEGRGSTFTVRLPLG